MKTTPPTVYRKDPATAAVEKAREKRLGILLGVFQQVQVYVDEGNRNGLLQAIYDCLDVPWLDVPQTPYVDVFSPSEPPPGYGEPEQGTYPEVLGEEVTESDDAAIHEEIPGDPVG